jgi:hypothetical protein
MSSESRVVSHGVVSVTVRFSTDRRKRAGSSTRTERSHPTGCLIRAANDQGAGWLPTAAWREMYCMAVTVRLSTDRAKACRFLDPHGAFASDW